MISNGKSLHLSKYVGLDLWNLFLYRQYLNRIQRYQLFLGRYYSR